MRKQALSSVDVAALAAELAGLLVGARVDKAYQPAKERILLRLRRKGAGKQDLLLEVGKFVTVTRRAPDNPGKPSMVAQILRTQLENSRLVGIRQIGFDRLLRLDFERGDGKHGLVFELFGDGNMLLLDGEDKIALPLRGEDFSARSLRKGEPYQAPPGPPSPFTLDATALKAGSAQSKDIVRYLATSVGLGPAWAEETCLRAGIDKKRLAAEMTDAEWQGIQETIAQLGRDIARNDLAPGVVYEGTEPVDAVPFVMLRYPAPKFSVEEAPTFREALDTYFMGTVGDEEEEQDDPRRARYDDAKGKLDFQVKQMEDAIAGFRVEEDTEKADGDAIYAAFQQVQAVLADLNAARKSRSWADVETILAEGRATGNPIARQVPELRPHEGSATLRLQVPDGERTVWVDLRKSVQDNADLHYAAAKKARSRRDGAETALKDARKRIAELERKGLDGFGTAPVRTVRTSRHFWFETYRWTITPTGLIAVGGRNAGQNDAVVKKYLRDGDRYVHADAHGAPSVVLRPADSPATEFAPEDLRAACHFAAASSRAWRQGGTASAYWVTPAQVSKTPRSGEFVPRGAWIIHGKRNAEDHLAMEWVVGMVTFAPSGVPLRIGEADPTGKAVAKLVGGAKASLAPFTESIVEIVPGDMEPNDAAAILAERFGVTVEEAQGVLPAGSVRFVDAALGTGEAS